MRQHDIEVLVIGAGVSGLTTGVCLAEAGLRVRIRTELPSSQTTSAAAGALWSPYLVEPGDRVVAWSRRSWRVLHRLADDPDTGVRLVRGVEATDTPADPPGWAGTVGATLCGPDELPAGYTAGWRFRAPVIDMPVYLRYLIRRFRAAGGDLSVDRLESISDVPDVPVVINCAGIGARDLVADPALVPVRGQVVVVDNPGITEFFAGDTATGPDLVYFFPHRDHVVLGGVAQPGAWNLTPDPATADRIVERCARIVPALRHARVLGHRVGLRPARPRVRLEEQDLGRRRLLHNYGHGGAGVTVSWGCAEEITDLVRGRRRS